MPCGRPLARCPNSTGSAPSGSDWSSTSRTVWGAQTFQSIQFCRVRLRSKAAGCAPDWGGLSVLRSWPSGLWS